LFITCHRERAQILDVVLVQPLGMATGRPSEARHRLFRHLHQASRGPYAPAFVEMTDDVLRCGFWKLGIAQRGPAALRKLFTARATASQPDAVTAIDFPHGEIVLLRATKALACRIDPR
jgi:hypothetical protein